MTLQFGDQVLSDQWAYLAIAIFALMGLVLILGIGLLVMWIKYSWIDRTNSKGWTGRDVTEWIFRKQGMEPVEIQSSMFYAKYWNHNKRRGTYKLRPWTHDRQSIWTLMEASQQAYATTIRASKGATFWAIFRLPSLIRLIGLIGGIALIALGAKDTDQNLDNIEWSLVGIGITVLFIAYVIADCGRVWVMWRNVSKLLATSGLQEHELKAINRIYFWRLVYSLAVVILEILKLIIQIAIRANENKSRN